MRTRGLIRGLFYGLVLAPFAWLALGFALVGVFWLVTR